MTARILVLDNFRERKAICLQCQHSWLMAGPEPEWDPEADLHLLDCPRCHHAAGAYANTWQVADADEVP